ncbi:probable methyltransferase-like protein 24 [Mytilus californianus]|uniref:probable methyltransferase-like protein 24 n=1 Tax=Mytilus californianus TaxID=6549 RepID=UPI002247C3BD|nr:probable methyltransferase-like protein 24 [Mytilus californianus]
MWSEVVNYVSAGQDVLIIDVGYLTEKVVDHVIKNGLLNKMQQLSIRISYGDPKSGIKYLAALKHLKKLFEAGFRIYWSRPELTGILQNNKNRTSCVYLDMIYNVCRSLQDTTKHDKDVNIIQNRTDHTYLVIPDDQALSKLNNKEITELYIRYLTSVQIHCKEVIRLGSVTDGGWNVCHDKSYRPSLPCLVYSFGINWDFSFDAAIVEAYSCDVHSFDPSMQRTDFRRAGHIWFHNLGLGNKTEIYRKDKWKISTLKDIYSDLGHKSTTVDILKIDIEAMEWISIPNMIQTGAIVNVRQLLVEFHAYSVLLQHLYILRSIYNEGFRIYWYHRNPGKRNIIQGKFVENTACYEVYFIRI